MTDTTESPAQDESASAMIQFTDQPDGVTVDIVVGINPEKLDRTKPSHIIASWLTQNMTELMQRAAFDLQREVVAATQDAGAE